jgi:tetratricopeptide (TPR) repeat protein
MRQKNLILLTLLFIITWFFVAVMGFLFVKVRLQNAGLKNSIAVLEKSLGYLDENLKKYKEVKKEEERYEKGVLDYLQWQFALRDQVNQAKQRLQDKINKIKDLKKDKSLLNLLYYNLGLSFTLAVDFGSAISAFEEAARFDPKDADSCYNLGLLYSTYSRDMNKALKYYKRYLELVPEGTKKEEVKERVKTLEKK